MYPAGCIDRGKKERTKDTLSVLFICIICLLDNLWPRNLSTVTCSRVYLFLSDDLFIAFYTCTLLARYLFATSHSQSAATLLTACVQWQSSPFFLIGCFVIHDLSVTWYAVSWIRSVPVKRLNKFVRAHIESAWPVWSRSGDSCLTTDTLSIRLLLIDFSFCASLTYLSGSDSFLDWDLLWSRLVNSEARSTRFIDPYTGS